MNSRTDITVIGGELYQPIADLVGKLISRSYAGRDRTGTLNYYERGYSAAIILLTCTAVESLVQRDRYFSSKSKGVKMSEAALHAYVKSDLKYRRYKHIEELFTVRNAIAHNHIWEVEYGIKIGGGRRHKDSLLVAGSHQIKPSNLPTQRKVPRTKILRMNLSPGGIDRTDVGKALSAGVHLLTFLSEKGSNPVNLVRESVVVQIAEKRERVQFSDLAQKVKDAL